jgi:hypothetical protein
MGNAMASNYAVSNDTGYETRIDVVRYQYIVTVAIGFVRRLLEGAEASRPVAVS